MTTQNDTLLLALKGIGFSKNEALVYLATLELGRSSIWEIAKKSGIKRPTCYVLLDELIWKGYATSTNDGRRTLYSVNSPKQLLRAVETRFSRFSNTITQLEALASNNPQKPTVRLYEGVNGIAEAYNASINQPKGGEILIYGTQLVETHYRDMMVDYINQRVKKGIHAKVILAETDYNRSVPPRDNRELRETRFLPIETFNPSIEVNIFGDSIAYIAHSEKTPFATVIENSTLASEEKQRFNLLFEQAKN